MYKKLFAFTIIELIVAAILSALVASAAISTFNILNIQYQDFQTHGKEEKELGNFKTSLNRDVEDAVWVHIDYNAVYLILKDRKIIYTFGENKVSRTVWKDKEKYEWLYDVVAQNYQGSFQEKAISKGLIDKLSIDILSNQQSFNIIFKKIYSSKELFDIEHGRRYY